MTVEVRVSVSVGGGVIVEVPDFDRVLVVVAVLVG